jgi:hypothetical protein
MVPIELNPETTINNQFPMRLPSDLMTRHTYLRRYHQSRKQLSFDEAPENQEQNPRNTFYQNSRPSSSWKQNTGGEQSPKKQNGKGASFLIKKMTAHATPKKSTSMRVGKYENIAYSTFLITSPSNHTLRQGN